MQCKDSHNRKAVPCHTSKFCPFGTLRNHCASEGPCTPHPPGARPPHACSRGSRPRLTPCPPRLWLTQRDPTSHAAWRFSLPHCSSRPPRRAVMMPYEERHESCRPVALRPSALGLARNCHRVTQPSGQERKGCAVPTSVLWPPPPPPPSVGSPNAASGTV